MRSWLLRLTDKIVAFLQLTINFFPFRLSKILNITPNDYILVVLRLTVNPSETPEMPRVRNCQGGGEVEKLGAYYYRAVKDRLVREGIRGRFREAGVLSYISLHEAQFFSPPPPTPSS